MNSLAITLKQAIFSMLKQLNFNYGDEVICVNKEFPDIITRNLIKPTNQDISDNQFEHNIHQNNECSCTMNNIAKRYAVITGATSGIGKEFAFQFARMGYHLILTGRQRNVITNVAFEIRKSYQIEVNILIVDLSFKKDLQKLLKILERKNNIEVLVNNAGFGFTEKFNEDDVKHQLNMLNVHVIAPLQLIHKVLPQMIQLKKGTIINVTSLAAFTPTSDNAMYTSTKSFLTNFTESLYLQLSNAGIRVQCLCPGYTHTNFHNKQGLSGEFISKRINNWMEPAEVVNYSLYCLEKGKIICVPGVTNRLLVSLISVLPRKIYYIFTAYIVNKVYENEKKNQYA